MDLLTGFGLISIHVTFARNDISHPTLQSHTAVLFELAKTMPAVFPC